MKIVLHPRALKIFKKIPPKQRHRIINKLEILETNPKSRDLNIKALADTSVSYRLRVGKMRVIYELDSSGKGIYITNIHFRGSVYS